jgi:IS4 transposase
MAFDSLMQRFAEQSPTTVMLRGTLANVFSDEAVDAIFDSAARRQTCRELTFSSVVDLLSLVVWKSRSSVHAAYEAAKEKFTVSVRSIYNKLAKTELAVSRALVRQTAWRLEGVVLKLGGPRRELLPGYRPRILDGNHLPSTEHRLKPLRTTKSGPLPGQALVLLDPDLKLIVDVIPCEDGHAQERTLLPQVLEQIQAWDLIIGDRNFCTTGFLLGIVQRQGAFLIRQHASTLTCQLLGERKRAGRTETGEVFEQKMELSGPEGHTLTIRRATIVLDKPTTSGETEIHLLTNLPAEKARAVQVADMYLERWTIENAFQEMEQALRSEVDTLAYPKAALLGFCIAALTFNVLSVVKSALVAQHRGQVEHADLSGYYLAEEIAAVYGGMLIALPEPVWTRQFAKLNDEQLAATLRELAQHVRVDRFRKRLRGAKKPRPKRSSGRINHHISTAKLLAAQKAIQTRN